MSPKLPLAALAAALLLGPLAPASRADLVTSADRGRYTDAGAHTPTNPNYTTGFVNNLGELRSFFTFDLAGVTGPITSARLLLRNVAFLGSPYNSPDPTETFSLFDVLTPTAALTNGTGGVAAFNDLGTGVDYGTRVISPADNGQLVMVELNGDGVAALNAAAGAGGTFALGGALATIDGAVGNRLTQSVFTGTTGASTVSLEFEVAAVPEPTSLALLGLAAVGAFGGARLKRRAV